jgi:cytochrome c553
MGVGDAFPPLAGQSATYLADQLKAWQSGTRHPGPLGLMQTIARNLSAADIQAISDYYASRAGSATGPATAAGGAPTRRAVP